MGEAARRNAANAAWLASLDEQERAVLRVAKALYKFSALEGACYRMTFFLKLYLEERHNVIGFANVGFANDGTDDIYASHAWFSFREKIADVAISKPLYPDYQKRGPVVICGHTVAAGWPYTYHLDRPAAGLAFVARMMSDPEIRIHMIAEENKHQQMMETAKSSIAMRIFLDAVPDGLDYRTLAHGVSRLEAP